MSTIVKMPQLGETVVEGTVSRWLKAPGDKVTKRDALLEITTDKIDTEVPAPADGILLKIIVAEGTTVKAGASLAIIGNEGEATGAAAQTAGQQQSPIAASSPSAPGAGMSLDAFAGHGMPPEAPAARAAPDAQSGRSFISPVVARMVEQHGIDLATITGTGLGGRVTKKDIEKHLQRSATQLAAGEVQEAAVEAPALDEEPTSAGSTALQPGEVLTPLSAMRRAIAQHMVMSKRTSPHVTSIFEADMTAVVHHREANKRALAAKGIALTYTPYFVAAIVAGLRAVPEANSRFTDAGIVINQHIHIGIAVAVEQGLIVPVLRDADEMNLQGLARGINELVARARDGMLSIDETRGGSFTLTNHGTGGSLFATPIINQPQTGIVGAGAIIKRPVVHGSGATLLPHADDSIVIRPMCYLSFTFDHRVLDGARGDAFLTAVKQRLENWE